MAEDSKETKKAAGPDYESADYWIKKARYAEKTFEKRFWKAAREAWAEFDLGTLGDGTSEEGTGAPSGIVRALHLFYSTIKTLAPAYYSKTPISVGKVRFGRNDLDARTAAKCMEGLGTYNFEEGDIDDVMEDVVVEGLVSGLFMTRVMLEGKQAKRQIPIMLDAAGGYVTQGGQPYQGQNIGGDEQTGFVGEEDYWEDLKCYPMALAFDEVMWTPEAKNPKEIREKYYRFCYEESEAYEMFPDVPPEQLRAAMKVYSATDKKNELEERKAKAQGQGELYLHGWEIWHEPTKKIRWISYDYKDALLKTSPDTYGLKGFFPSPKPVISTKQRKSMFPRPLYCYVADLYDNIHDCLHRIYNLSKSMRRRFAVDASLKGKLGFLISDADESEYVFIEGLMALVEKGGLESAIKALPVDDLSRAMTELSNLLQLYEQKTYEVTGCPDILRGASDPLETAKAQEIKNLSASNRFRADMNKVARLARDTNALTTDLQLGAYPPERIMKISGVEYMDPAMAQRFPAAYALLTNDEDRCVRLDIETDSTSYVNEQINQQNMNVAIQTVTGGLQSINGMPPLQQAIGFKTIQAALSGLRMGKDFQDDIDMLMQQMMEQAKNPPPPPPDYEQMKIQLKNQELQMKGQDMAGKNQIAQMQLQLKSQEVAAANQIKGLEYQLKAQAQGFFEWTEQVRLQLEGRGIVIDELSFQVGAQESLMEEERLSREVDAKTIAALKPLPQPAAPAPSANITLVNQAAEPLVVPIPEPMPVLPLL